MSSRITYVKSLPFDNDRVTICLFTTTALRSLYSLQKELFQNNSKRSKGCSISVCHSLCKTIGIVVQWPVLFIAALSGSVNAQEGAVRQMRYNISLPSQSVADSLSDLSALTNQVLLFSYDEVFGVKASPVVGECTLPEALDIMLQGTGFPGSPTKRMR